MARGKMELRDSQRRRLRLRRPAQVERDRLHLAAQSLQAFRQNGAQPLGVLPKPNPSEPVPG